MSSQEDLSETPECPNGDLFKPKKKPKAIRVLTVMAYVLSVSMAAILLSIYYIFMWEGRPHIGAFGSGPVENPLSLTQNKSFISGMPLDGKNLSGNPNYEDYKTEPLIPQSRNDISDEFSKTANITRNSTSDQTTGEPKHSTLRVPNTIYNASTNYFDNSTEYDVV